MLNKLSYWQAKYYTTKKYIQWSLTVKRDQTFLINQLFENVNAEEFKS